MQSAGDLSPIDRVEILELIASYGMAWDAADADAFVGLFADDAVCTFYRNGADIPSVELRGRQALRHAIETRAGGFRDMGLVTSHFMVSTQLRAVDTTTTHARSNG